MQLTKRTVEVGLMASCHSRGVSSDLFEPFALNVFQLRFRDLVLPLVLALLALVLQVGADAATVCVEGGRGGGVRKQHV